MNRFTIFWQIVIFYAVIAAIVYFISDYSIFVPPKATYSDSLRIQKIITSKGESISAMHMVNPEAKNTIIYSHGNAEDIGMVEDHARQLQASGYSVITYDYPGYGTSDGVPNRSGTYEAIDAVHKYLVDSKEVDPNSIILYGRSLGTGPTINLATKQNVRAVILESPFVSAFRVVTNIPIFPVDKFKNLAKINKISVPILFIHGTDDKVIPIWHSKKLYEVYEGPKEFYWVEDAGHNNVHLIGGTKYFDKIKSFIDGLD